MANFFEGYNLQIQEQAKEELKAIETYLGENVTINYEFAVVQREGEMGPLIEKWWRAFN